MVFTRLALVLTIFAICSAGARIRKRKITQNGFVTGIALLADLDKNTRSTNTNTVNNFIDTYFVKNLNNYITKVKKDSITMKDFYIEGKVLGIGGEASLSQGWLNTLSSMKRQRSISINGQYPNYRITIPLTLTNLKGGYHYSGTAGGIKIYGQGSGTSNNCKLNLVLSYDAIERRFELEEFKVKTPGEVDIRFNGNFVGNIPNVWVDTYFPLVKAVLQETLDHNLENTLYDFIDEHNKLTCDASNTC